MPKEIEIPLSLSFDDILLLPNESNFIPSEADLATNLTKSIKLRIPAISAAMDTVTEFKMAIAMAKNGGIGCLHKNLSIEMQTQEVRKVKKYESGIVSDPICIGSSSTVAELLDIKKKNEIGSFPVVDENKKLIGIVTSRDILFTDNKQLTIDKVMTRDVVTIRENESKSKIIELFSKHKVEKLVIVNERQECIGMVTSKDLKNSMDIMLSAKDTKGRLLVAAATGIGQAGIERAESLIDAEVDVVIVDTAHGHSVKVLETVRHIKKHYGDRVQVVGGNVVTPDAVRALIDCGADAVKIGIGPGSICTTRIVTGVGCPQFSAIVNCVKAAEGSGVPIIADGGIKNSGDIAKAIAAGASTVMIGGLIAGTDESPGEVVHHSGRPHKEYRGMGSIVAMSRGSSDRYFQLDQQKSKFVPEGIEAVVPYKGSLSVVLHQLIGGLKSAMGYTGNQTIEKMRENCEFTRVTSAGVKENHPHSVMMTKEAPNYSNI